MFHSSYSFQAQQGKQCTYNVTSWCVCITIVDVEKQKVFNIKSVRIDTHLVHPN